jgi:hypothetical protein
VKPICTLAATVGTAVALAACGGQTHAAQSSPAGQTTSAHPRTSTAAAKPSTGSAPTGESQGGSPANSISKINDAFKHLSPQQLQEIKKRLPAYMHALEQCAKATGGAQAATLACVRSHGFGPAGP